MRRARTLIASALVALGAGSLLVAGPSPAHALVSFGPGNPAWDNYYAHPSDHSTWAAYCAGGNGTVILEALGVPACGPTGSTNIELAGSTPQNTIYTPGFQCVELVIRYLNVVKGLGAVVVNGAQIVDGYSAAYNIPKVSNGTVGKYPVTGTVLSFTSTGDYTDLGHAAVVTASSVDASGNGSVTFANENFGNTAESITEPVTNWSMRISNLIGAGGAFTGVKWLDFSTVSPTPTPTISGSPGPSPSASTTPSPQPSPSSSITPTPTSAPTATPSMTPSPAPATKFAAPKLTQSSSHGVVTLTIVTDSSFSGHPVVCFQRSGMTGTVRPLGASDVDGTGVATRILQMRSGQLLAMYCKLLGASSSQIVTPYSNNITFKVH